MEELALVCLISHPEIDPDSVTNKLGLEPYLSQKKGQNVTTPDGRVTGSKYEMNKWGYKTELAARNDLGKRVEELIDHLYESRAFVRKVSEDGGRVSVFLNVPKPSSLALMMTPEALSKIGEMRIRFGFEIF